MTKKYIVAIPIDDSGEIFSFNTKEDRDGFLKELKEKMPDTDYAVTETEDQED